MNIIILFVGFIASCAASDEIDKLKMISENYKAEIRHLKEENRDLKKTLKNLETTSQEQSESELEALQIELQVLQLHQKTLIQSVSNGETRGNRIQQECDETLKEKKKEMQELKKSITDLSENFSDEIEFHMVQLQEKNRAILGLKQYINGKEMALENIKNDHEEQLNKKKELISDLRKNIKKLYERCPDLHNWKDESDPDLTEEESQ